MNMLPYTTRLRAQGFRLTPQRLAILQALHDAEGHLTPLQMCERVQATLPGVTEATVYRTLNFLAEQGLALAAHIGSGQLVYEFPERAHHHLVCRACGHTHEIEHQVLEDLYARFAAETGFQIDRVHVTFFGLCPACCAN